MNFSKKTFSMVLLTVSMLTAISCKSVFAQTEQELQESRTKVEQICKEADEHIRIAHEARKVIEAEHFPQYSEEVPLPEDLQKYIFDACSEHGIKYCLFLALCEQESQFGIYGTGDSGRYAVKSKSGDYGMCQTNRKYSWQEVRKNYGWEDDVTILYDPFRSVDAGIYMFEKCVDKYGNTEAAYDAYNRGLEHHGSTKNSRAVVNYWVHWSEVLGDI